MEILLGLGYWLAVIVVLFLLFLVVATKWYFPNVTGFESRNPVIGLGMLAIVLSGAAFFFLPFTSIHFHTVDVKVSLTQMLGSQIGGAVDSKVGDAVNTTVNQVANSALKTVATMLQQFFLVFAAIATLLVAVLVIIIVFMTREEVVKEKAGFHREHIFEFQKGIFEEISKDSERR